MILRRIALRQAGSTNGLLRCPSRQWRRCLSSEVDSIQGSLQNSLKETQSIETLINSQLTSPVTPINPETHATAEHDTAAQEWREFHRQQKRLQPVGASVAPHYRPHTLLTNPPSPGDVTLELLLASQSHMGHVTSAWHSANSRYIFGVREGIHIISLDATAAHLRRAAKVVSKVAEKAGIILFVGTRRGQDRCVVRAAELAGGYHLFERWIPGTITNGQQILEHCPMKVVDHHDKEVPGFERQLAQRAVLKPDLVVCLNPVENTTLLHECALNHIPTVGIIDTDANPAWVTYPIPANDDSLRCVQVIAGVLGRAGEEGQRRRQQAAQAGEATYNPSRDLYYPKVSEDDALASIQDVESEMFAPMEELRPQNTEAETLVEEATHNRSGEELP